MLVFQSITESHHFQLFRTRGASSENSDFLHFWISPKKEKKLTCKAKKGRFAKKFIFAANSGRTLNFFHQLWNVKKGYNSMGRQIHIIIRFVMYCKLIGFKEVSQQLNILYIFDHCLIKIGEKENTAAPICKFLKVVISFGFMTT